MTDQWCFLSKEDTPVVTNVSDFNNELSDVDQFSGLESPTRGKTDLNFLLNNVK